MNPEFRRQLWLQFSPTRLVVLPLLILAVLGVVVLSQEAQGPTNAIFNALALTGAGLFALLVLGMGTLSAGASVVDEFVDRTWDQQRMSAMQPWAMTWGKLAGASAYGWYGGALSLLMVMPRVFFGDEPAPVLQAMACGILAGLFLQALLLAINLQLTKVEGRIARRGGVWLLGLVLLMSGNLALQFFSSKNGQPSVWWNYEFTPLAFSILSLALFAVCALIAAWRSMAEMLAVPQLPWGWPALALLLTLYMTGFLPEGQRSLFGFLGLLNGMALTYGALLMEPQPRPLWQRVLSRAKQGQWRAAWQQLPYWPTTFLMAIPFAVLAVLVQDSQVYAGNAAFPYALTPIVLVLLMGRDCLLALFFAFAPQSRRPLLSFLVLMFVLYVVLPWLFKLSGSTIFLGIVQPFTLSGPAAIVVAVLHALAAFGALWWRWGKTQP